MKYGIREIADVVLKAKSTITLGGKTYYKDEPVLYFDTLKTSSLEGAATTVYAQGGAGNARLVAWEGEKTLTFNMEDALASIETLTLLTGGSFEEIKGSLPTVFEISDCSWDAEAEEVVTETLRYLSSPFVSNIDLQKLSKITVYFSGKDLTPEEQEILRASYGIIILAADGTTNPVTNKTMVGFDGKPRLSTMNIQGASAYLAQLNSSTARFPEDKKFNIRIEVVNASGEFERICIHSNTEITNINSYQTRMTIPFDKWYCIYASDAEMMPMWIQPENQSELFGGKSLSQGKSSDLIFTGPEIKMTVATEDAVKRLWSGPTIINFYSPIYGRKSQRIMIDADIASVNFYLEANTLFRDTYGTDHPAVFVIPNCKIQSNFTLNMASTGDPSTFNFVLDAFPGYSRFDPTKKVLAMLKLVEGSEPEAATIEFE